MAVGRFTNARSLAARLIAKNGERSTHVRVIDAPTAGKPWRSSGSTKTETVVNAAWFEYDQRRIDGDLIRSGDREVYIPATDFESAGLSPASPNPTTDVMVRIDGSRWQIIGPVRTIQPNEEQIMFQVQARLQ